MKWERAFTEGEKTWPTKKGSGEGGRENEKKKENYGQKKQYYYRYIIIIANISPYSAPAFALLCLIHLFIPVF